MKHLFFLYFFVIAGFAFSQNYIDFQNIDSVFVNKKLIGLGESTHGTSEFSKMRFQLFKYLVEKQGFDTFILEADVSACRDINRYIHNQNINLEKALEQIQLWPWQTTEMVEIIEWMKTYVNTSNKNIEFIGCDKQFIDDDYIELKKVIKNTDLEEKVDSVFSNLSNSSGLLFIQNRKFLWNEIKNKLPNTFDLNVLSKSVDQWFERELTTRNYSRDSCMAENILFYMNNNKTSKAIYWAHNYHISNSFYSNDDVIIIKTTGSYLRDKLNDDYLSFACISKEMTFNALIGEKNKILMRKNMKTAGGKKYIEYRLGKFKMNSFIISSKQIPTINQLYITNIGAGYGKDCTGRINIDFQKLTYEMFDFFLFINKSNPTHLLSNVLKKYPNETSIFSLFLCGVRFCFLAALH
jgi:erythromycin esterase